MQNVERAKLMSLSWEIQRRKNYGRSYSLAAAWVIFLYEDLTIYHLAEKHQRSSYPKAVDASKLTLF